MKMLATALMLFFALSFNHSLAFADETQLSFDGGLVNAYVSWMKGPSLNDESILHVEWRANDGTPILPPGEFLVSFLMPSMGQNGSPTRLEKGVNKDGQPLIGIYDVHDIYFTMSGEWEVQLMLTYPNGAQEANSIALSL